MTLNERVAIEWFNDMVKRVEITMKLEQALEEIARLKAQEPEPPTPAG